MVNRPPASFFYEWPPFRAAAAARRNQHYRRTWWDGFVAALRLWAALELSRGRFASAATAIYSVFRPNLEIPHQSAGGVFERLRCALSA